MTGTSSPIPQGSIRDGVSVTTILPIHADGTIACNLAVRALFRKVLPILAAVLLMRWKATLNHALPPLEG